MSNSPTTVDRYVTRHLLFGWWCLFGFVVLGLALDYFHAFKIGWYLDVGNETRRLMGTLAHAHGTLLGGINIGYALTIHMTGDRLANAFRVGSPCLLSGSLMVPLGFLLGGIFTLKSEPGIGVFFVPIGGILLLVSIGVTAIALRYGAASTVQATTAKKRRKHR